MTMFPKRTQDQIKFDFFIRFLTAFIEDGKSYKETIDLVINDTVALCNREKDYFTIDRENYSIIVYLSRQMLTAKADAGARGKTIRPDNKSILYLLKRARGIN